MMSLAKINHTAMEAIIINVDFFRLESAMGMPRNSVMKPPIERYKAVMHPM
jgi:hypothetical protein